MLLTTSSTSAGSSSKAHADWSSKDTRPSVPEATSPTFGYSHDIWKKRLEGESMDVVYHCTVTKRHDENGNLTLARRKPLCPSYREQGRRGTAASSTSAGTSRSYASWSSKDARVPNSDHASYISESYLANWEESRAKKSRHAPHRRITIMKDDDSGALFCVRSTPKHRRPNYRQQERKERIPRGPAIRDGDLEL
jgi:hypothetical protein